MSLILQPRLGPQGADTPISKAHQVCLACRKQKRRCDKSLPACSLCKRMDRPCYYSYSLGGGNGKSTLDSRHQPVIAEDLQALKARLAELESRLLLNGGSGSRGTSSSPGAMMAGREEVGLLGGAGPMDEDILDGMSAATAATAVIGGGSSTTGSLFSTAALHDLRWLDRPAANKFPSVYFLDRDAFKWMAKTIPRPRNVEIPGDVLEHLGDSLTIQRTTTEYFATIHVWMPIVSKKRMSLGFPLLDAGPDLALLFLAMRIITTQPQDGVRPAELPLYGCVKRVLAMVESSGLVSLMYLQALVLVALYEFGHAIYPAAWMTVGACVRYADMLGLPNFKDGNVTLGICTTWSEAEERRRVWWGVMVLDRAICLGSNKRPLSPEPVDTEIYPVDDDAWDDGNLSSTVQRPVMFDVRDSLPGAFARTCQSAVLIGKSLAHIREHGRTGKRSPDRDPGEVEARTMALLEKLETACAVMQDEAMSSQQQTTAESDMPGLGITSTLSPSTTTTTASSTMLSSSDDRYLAYLTPLCLARSALIATLDAYSCPESFKDSCAVSREIAEQEARLQLRSVEAIKVAATAVSDVARKLLPLLGAGGYDMSGGDSEQRRHDSLTQSMNLSRLSPLVLDAMYGAAATLHWMWKEMGDFEAGVALDLLKQCFTRISSRWRLANEYAGIIAQTELT